MPSRTPVMHSTTSLLLYSMNFDITFQEKSLWSFCSVSKDLFLLKCLTLAEYVTYSFVEIKQKLLKPKYLLDL